MVDQSRASSAGNPTVSVQDRIAAIQGKDGEKNVSLPDTPASFAGKRFKPAQKSAPVSARKAAQPPAAQNRSKPLPKFTAQTQTEAKPKAPPPPATSAEHTAAKGQKTQNKAPEVFTPKQPERDEAAETIQARQKPTISPKTEPAISPVAAERTNATRPAGPAPKPELRQTERNQPNVPRDTQTRPTAPSVQEIPVDQTVADQHPAERQGYDQPDDRVLSFKDTAAFKNRNPLMKATSWLFRDPVGGFDGTKPLMIRKFSGGILKNLWGLLEHKNSTTPDITREAGVYTTLRGNTIEVHPSVKLDLQAKTRLPNMPFISKQRDEHLTGYAILSKSNDAASAATGQTAGRPAANNAPEEIPDFSQNDRPIFIRFTGAGLSAENRFSDGKYLASKFDANVLSLSHRGKGNSTGGLSSNRSRVQDGIATLNHLLNDQQIAPERIVLVGYSMGGNIASNVLQAAEAKGLKLGGLLLDRPMENLSTGAEALVKTVPPKVKMINGDIVIEQNPSFPRVFGATILRLIAWTFGEKFNTSRALKTVTEQNRADRTPIFGTFDTDPIGKTSQTMLAANTINHAPMGGGHGASVQSTVNALINFAQNNPGTDAERLLQLLQPQNQAN